MRILNNNFFDIFKIFFPSWAFFDESGTNINIKFRIAKNPININNNTWESTDNNINRSVFKLIYNPEVNLKLAINSNLELLIDSINFDSNYDKNKENINDNIYYKITKNYVKYYIFNLHTSNEDLSEIKSFQFKISIKNELDDDDIFISEIFNMDELNG
ncbi:MAG: hypothetical protein ACOVNU_11155 [Candidatus Kapaibacteriota bacterium]|jgi:hypothetical protein